jgi:hypothetical protein
VKIKETKTPVVPVCRPQHGRRKKRAFFNQAVDKMKNIILAISKTALAILLVSAIFGTTPAEAQDQKNQLIGTWECQKDAGVFTFVFTEREIDMSFKGTKRTGVYAIDTSTTPTRIDIKWKNMEPTKTIIQFKTRDELLLAETRANQPRPLNFSLGGVVLKRQEDLSDPTSIYGSVNTVENPPAQWMSGKWGIGWRFSNKYTEDVDTQRVIEQVKTIPGMTYVLFNLSNGDAGLYYTAPHTVLSKINPGTCSERDLVGELAPAFQAEGYKVIMYMATQRMADPEEAKNETEAKRIENWRAWVKKHYGSDDASAMKKAYAEVVVWEFAQRYGTQIDGWWFDKASGANLELVHQEITRANPKAIIAFCRGGLGTVENHNPGYEDYTFGHPKPVRRGPASREENLTMVRSIENSKNGFLIKDGQPSLGHMFMPMKNKWNSGADIVWPEEQAVEWMQRVLRAGGAWTWNVPFHHSTSELNQTAVEFAKRVGAQLQ